MFQEIKLDLFLLLFTILFTNTISENQINAGTEDFEDFSSALDRLYHFLTKKHNKNILHRVNGSVPCNVNVTLVYAQLIELNADAQTITILLEYQLLWNDFTLEWNPDDFAGIRSMVVPRSAIFIPDVAHTNIKTQASVVPDDINYAKIYSTGMVEYYINTVIEAICIIAVQSFPFDTQSCQICVTSYTFNESELTLTAGTAKNYGQIGNGEWSSNNVTGTSVSYVDENNACFTIALQRRPTYYIAVVVVPTYLLATVCILGLFGPKPDSDIGPEKVPLSLATLMSMSVLLSIASGTMPKNAMSALGNFILLEIGLCAFAALISVLISFFRSVRRLRGTKDVKVKAHKKLEKQLTMTVDAYDDKHFIKELAPMWNDLYSQIKALLLRSEKRADYRMDRERDQAEWSRLALKINIFLVIVFTVANGGILVYFLTRGD